MTQYETILDHALPRVGVHYFVRVSAPLNSVYIPWCHAISCYALLCHAMPYCSVLTSLRGLGKLVNLMELYCGNNDIAAATEV